MSLSQATSFERRRRFRLRAPAAVAVARLRARPGRSLLVVTGVAAATALLAGVVGGGLAARDRALQRSLLAIPPDARSFTVSAYDLPFGKTYGQANRAARSALALVTTARPAAVTRFPLLRIDHEVVSLGGVGRPVLVLPAPLGTLAGRLPAGPLRGRPGRPRRAARGSTRPGSTSSASGSPPRRALRRRSRASGAPLLVTRSAAAFEQLPAFQGISRLHLWSAPLDPRSVHVWQVSRILAGESAAQALLAAAGGDTYSLTGADAALQSAQRDGRVASQRMVLVGGEISALLLGFALVAAVGLRRGVWNEARRLSQRGARRGQVWLAVATEVGAMTVTGVVAGLLIGTLAVALVGGDRLAAGGAAPRPLASSPRSGSRSRSGPGSSRRRRSRSPCAPRNEEGDAACGRSTSLRSARSSRSCSP